MIRFIKFLIGAAADVYQDRPFAQCVQELRWVSAVINREIRLLVPIVSSSLPEGYFTNSRHVKVISKLT